MNVLEKILEEIEDHVNMVKNIPVNEDDDFLDGEECYEWQPKLVVLSVRTWMKLFLKWKELIRRK